MTVTRAVYSCSFNHCRSSSWRFLPLIISQYLNSHIIKAILNPCQYITFLTNITLFSKEELFELSPPQSPSTRVWVLLKPFPDFSANDSQLQWQLSKFFFWETILTLPCQTIWIKSFLCCHSDIYSFIILLLLTVIPKMGKYEKVLFNNFSIFK